VTTLLTGASGFLGVHTLAALLDAGERVRAYVRTPSKLGAALSPLGLSTEDDRIEVVSGDMTDAPRMRSAAEGCDALVHAAATFSFKRSDAERMRRENEQGTRAALEAGLDAGCRAMVHVSSTVALLRPGAPTLDHRSPLGPGLGIYSASKVSSERVARTMQDRGAPVTIVNPGGVVGPHDPYLGESNLVILEALTGKMPVYPRGQLQFVDVRDVAAVLVAAARQASAGRYLVPGHDVAVVHEPLREITGLSLKTRVVPAGLVRAVAMPGYLTGWSFLPGAVEGIRIMGCGASIDASHTTTNLGVEARPLHEAFRDTIRWLVEAGHLSAEQAGKAAP
jgi:dihydroflavonol-4-reductase